MRLSLRKVSSFFKATAAIPHEGGKRFGVDSVEGKLVLDWLRAGALDSPEVSAPTDLVAWPDGEVIAELRKEVKIRMIAKFADGTGLDVSRLAVYHPSNLLVTIRVNIRILGTYWFCPRFTQYRRR